MKQVRFLVFCCLCSCFQWEWFSAWWLLDGGQSLEGEQGKSFCQQWLRPKTWLSVASLQEDPCSINNRIKSFSRTKEIQGRDSVFLSRHLLLSNLNGYFLKIMSFPCLSSLRRRTKQMLGTGKQLGLFSAIMLSSKTPRHQDRVPESQLGTANDAAMSGILSVSWLTWQSKSGISFPCCSRERCNLLHPVASSGLLLLGFIMSQGLQMESAGKQFL